MYEWNALHDRELLRLRRYVPLVARGGTLASLVFCGFMLLLYTAASLPDPGFSDGVVFMLLRLLHYASLLLCLFSLGALALAVHRLVLGPSLGHVLRVCGYFISALAGAGLSMLNSFIVAATGGNS
jgi:hypothetical protein